LFITVLKKIIAILKIKMRNCLKAHEYTKTDNHFVNITASDVQGET